MSTTTVYTKPGCIQCTMTKRALDAAGIDHQLVDVTTDQAALEHIKQLGYLTVPVVIDPTGHHWAGFQPNKISELTT